MRTGFSKWLLAVALLLVVGLVSSCDLSDEDQQGGQADRGGYVEMMGLYRLDAGPILTEE